MLEQANSNVQIPIMLTVWWQASVDHMTIWNEPWTAHDHSIRLNYYSEPCRCLGEPTRMIGILNQVGS